MTNRAMLLLAVVALGLGGCYQGVDPLEGADGGQDGGAPPRVPVGEGDDAGPDSGEPGHHGEGDATLPGGRKVRRMTAAQFHESLVTVTGQPWPLFEDYAGAMGQADFAEITEEGRELSVTFDKFVHDAAIFSCDAAVQADVGGANPATLLRWAELADRDEITVRRNLDYLMLRFLGQEMKTDDVRVEPWMNLLMAEPAEGDLTDELMQERWTAVCVGLVTHPDFVTY